MIRKNDAEYKKRAYLVQHMNSRICSESTSGGAFTAIATSVIKKGGVVYGASFTDDYCVTHIRVDSIDGLKQFRNSKYVQSRIDKEFRRVKEDLNNGMIVCFSGTPCQVAGLVKYLKNKGENLILVDIVCRAVPSPGVWHKYLDEVLKPKGSINSIRFRDKDLGYQYSTMKVEYDNYIQRDGIESDYWLRMFFSGMIIRPSCTKCRFRNINRQSDITLWDCFNIHDYHTKWNEKMGATRVITHTSLGEKYIREISEDVRIREIKLSSAVHNVREMIESPATPLDRKDFFDDLNTKEFSDVLSMYFPKTFSIRVKKSMRLLLNKINMDMIVKRIVIHR